MGEVVEGMAIGFVSEIGIGCWKPLQALQRYVSKVSTEVAMFR